MNFINKLSEKIAGGLRTMVTTTVALTASAFQAAMAALPTAATDAITSVDTDAAALITAIWPIVVTVTVGFVLIKLFRRGVRGAT